MLPDVTASLDGTALVNFIDRYESGRIQQRPRLRFVDPAGRACPAAALAGAESSADFMNGEAGRAFRGGVLERISRAFEDGELDVGALYRECLLERARRDAAPGGGSGAPTERSRTSTGRDAKACRTRALGVSRVTHRTKEPWSVESCTR